MKSDYYQGLDSVARQRYDEKISAVGEDPYLIPPAEQKKARDCSIEELPALCYPDIVMFLVEVPGYSVSALKAYKSLDAYRHFLRGWVRSLMVCTKKEKFIITSKVITSEDMNENPHAVWAVIEPSGLVVSGHCTCMASSDVACSHVAATLFALDAYVRIQQETSSPLLSNSPRSRRCVEPVCDINYSYPNKRRKTTDENTRQPTSVIPPPTAEEMKQFYDGLASSGPTV
ncbi:uncharacterized protein LOC124883136 isoform X3 [Girardinichthys multiradiatus]|uniref:uncharacterized protein LOC124883136 isoform X3 n=1 Tax=Girardinichthys multiradiatus TaxID=208333 RepID=UPI001FAC4940|nr:uncharacterized protein LOC124883136 isoform X3 [Girardinichthys multiradiatus]